MTVTVCPVAVSRIATRVASSLVLNALPCARATQVTGREDFRSHIGRPSITLQILNVIHFFLFFAHYNFVRGAAQSARHARDGSRGEWSAMVARRIGRADFAFAEANPQSVFDPKLGH